MIRINLLPEAKKKTAKVVGPSGSGTVWAGIYLVGVAIWGIGLGVVYFTYQAKLEEQLQTNSALQARIEELRSKSARLEEVQAKLDASRRLEEVVSELNKARTGPIRVLMEISDILSEGEGPTIDPQELERLRRENPLAGFNPAWDTRRLWITSFHEENRNCQMTGIGKTNEDVAEFLRRLGLSELFTAVALTKTQATEVDEAEGIPFISFELTCRVTY